MHTSSTWSRTSSRLFPLKPNWPPSNSLRRSTTSTSCFSASNSELTIRRLHQDGLLVCRSGACCYPFAVNKRSFTGTSTNTSGNSNSMGARQQEELSGSGTSATSSSSSRESLHSHQSSGQMSASPTSSTSTGELSWKDKLAHLPIFRKHKMTRNGNDFESLPEPRILPKFQFYNRLFYSSPFRTKRLENYFRAEGSQVLSMATTYQHDVHKDISVTLVPLSHSAHPQFYYQVDLLLCQHESVLMEGRVPFKQAPFSTLVPPRPLPNQIRPAELSETTQAWEPKDMSAYWQPFSWGVRDSPNYTVIHAADCYDYEKLPVLASLRWNLPFLLGSFKREVHCLSMIPFLVDNGYKKFAVPWGAAHMPIMHEMLGQNGFSIVSVSALPVFDEADGDISTNYVRMNRKILSRKDVRDDIWLVFGFILVACTILYFNSRVEINGIDLKTGGPADFSDAAVASQAKLPDMFEKKPRTIDTAIEASTSVVSKLSRS